MGSGRWSPSTYHERATAKAASGKDVFDYSHEALRSGQLRPHQTLDPRDMDFRESRDSAEHPNSNAIIIGLDVTGSMGRVFRGIHSNLPQLHELLLGHNYIADPQILFAAVGDATCDAVPLQVGQFESDNRMDQNLENIILEGGGGGGKKESYELMLYVAARHTRIDCWEKRQRKGYLFMIGDEAAYPVVKRDQVQRLFGSAPQADIPLPELIDEARQRYHIYYLIPGGASHGTDKQILQFWNDLLGAQSVIHLEDPQDTSECIALTIGINEGAITVADGARHLHKRGIVSRTIDRLSQALTGILPGGATGGSSPSGRSRRL
jgi:hypothetical protein